MTLSRTPLALVALSACSYGLLFRATRAAASAPSAAARLRAISAGHAALTTLLALYVLQQPRWAPAATANEPRARPGAAPAPLDDAANPLIQGRSRGGNAITALETGYLLYDIGAMVATYGRRGGRRVSLSRAVRAAPLMLAHHGVLVAALLWLQVYIAQARERGIWVVLAFLVMNATNPLLHARWWLRRVGNDSRLVDLGFAAVFALVRAGVPFEVLRRYGAYHHLGPYQAFQRLRTPCKICTTALFGLNAVWWIWLVKGVGRRHQKS